jgi:multiple sugar transport system substrate-binding protein
VDFIPQGEAELKRQLADYGKQMKMDVALETINENDLQTRITAAIQSGSGADIVQMLHNWPHLYAPALADMTDLAEWKERDQGKFYAQSEAAARDSSRWLGLPHCITPAMVNYRQVVVRGRWARASHRGHSTNTERSAPSSRRRAALRPDPRPHGQRRAHLVVSVDLDLRRRGNGQDGDEGDAELEEHGGGGQVDDRPSGRKRATRVVWPGTTPRTTAPFHSGRLPATLNGGSIYILARRRPDIKDEKGQPLWPDIGHFRYPDGRTGPPRPIT